MNTTKMRRVERQHQVRALEASVEALRNAWQDRRPSLDGDADTRVGVQQPWPELAQAIERTIATWDMVAQRAQTAEVQRERQWKERLAEGIADVLAFISLGQR